MRFIFKKMFYYSIDMPAKYTQLKAQMEKAIVNDFQKKLGKYQRTGGRRDSSSSSGSE